MFPMILPNEAFCNPEDEERIYAALDEFFETNVFCADEFDEKRSKVIDELKDEPIILELLRDDMELYK